MYAHPEITSDVLRLTWNAGHCGACPACAELLEVGDLNGLVDRVLGLLVMRGRWSPEKMASKLMRRELMRFYGKVSRQREPFEPPEVYNAKRA